MQDGHALSDVKIMEDSRGEYVISTDPDRLDLAVIHEFLASCYWAKGIPRDVVASSILCALAFIMKGMENPHFWQNQVEAGYPRSALAMW